MATGTAARQRGYKGPAIFSGGFRPMFLLAGTWAVLAMALWIWVITGQGTLPTAFGPVDWHAHALLFGYGSAVVCGFLFTAVPNWTGRLPVTGTPLAAMAALWIAGRVVILVGAGLPAVLVAAVDLAFLVALAAIIGREIIAGGNRRNLPVLGLVVLFLFANALYHLDAARGGTAVSGIGLRLGASALIGLLSLIGGRVVPSFTRNWLARRAPGALPAPFGRFDTATLLASGVALAAWSARPEGWPTAVLLLLAGGLQLVRLARWAGWRTLGEPLVAVLHAGYGFIPAGFLLLGAAGLWPGTVPAVAGIHTWLAGAVGTMTLAVMTRASLGHSGRALTAGRAESAIYLAVISAAIARIIAGLGGPDWWLWVAALAWIGAFGGFTLVYFPRLARPRLAAKRANSAPH